MFSILRIRKQNFGNDKCYVLVKLVLQILNNGQPYQNDVHKTFKKTNFSIPMKPLSKQFLVPTDICLLLNTVWCPIDVF